MGYDGEIDDMLRIRVQEAESEEEIFTLLKKITRFRLGGRAHILTLLEFARRLGLYQAVELEEDGFNVYVEGSLRSDDNFNATDYWLSISREENLGLSRSHTSTIRNLILRVIHKMITYDLCQRTTRHQNGYANVAWVIAKWMKRKGVGTQKESQICCGQFISKLARKCKVLTKDVWVPLVDMAADVAATLAMTWHVGPTIDTYEVWIRANDCSRLMIGCSIRIGSRGSVRRLDPEAMIGLLEGRVARYDQSKRNILAGKGASWGAIWSYLRLRGF
ncbi:hypothetical protein Tco_0341468 [Tanacetum coccineum]